MSQRAYSPKCSDCRQRTMVLSPIPYSVTINHDGREYAVEIPSLTVPKCSNCGNFVLDDEALAEIDRAFRRKAHLLTPEAIREGRKRLGLDQQAFADRLGIAVSTLSRWENGIQVQQRSLNRAMTAYFRSASMRQCYAQIESTEKGEWVPVPAESRPVTAGITISTATWDAGPLKSMTNSLPITAINTPPDPALDAATVLPRNIGGRSLILRTPGGC